METTIDRFGRVVIPKDVREQLDLDPGSVLDVERHEREIRLRPGRPQPSPGPSRARPAPELLEAQIQAKARWRREMAARPLREKIALLLEMQRRLHPILQQRRTLQWWERPWDIEP